MTTSREEIEKLIRNYSRRLQLLKEQQAIQGISTDPGIIIQIEDIEAELKQLRVELATLPPTGDKAASGGRGGVTIGNVGGNISGAVIAGGDVKDVTININPPPADTDDS